MDFLLTSIDWCQKRIHTAPEKKNQTKTRHHCKSFSTLCETSWQTFPLTTCVLFFFFSTVRSSQPSLSRRAPPPSLIFDRERRTTGAAVTVNQDKREKKKKISFVVSDKTTFYCFYQSSQTVPPVFIFSLDCTQTTCTQLLQRRPVCSTAGWVTGSFHSDLVFLRWLETCASLVLTCDRIWWRRILVRVCSSSFSFLTRFSFLFLIPRLVPRSRE